MMKYEKIVIDALGDIQEHIIIDNGDGSFESFPMDESNPRYRQFLVEIENSSEL